MSDMNVPPDQPEPTPGAAPPPPPPSQGGWSSTPPGGPPQQYGAAGAPVSDFGAPLAEWWKRVVALLIDGLVIGIPAGIIFSALGVGFGQNARVDPVTGEVTGMGGLITAFLVGSLIYQVVYLIYFSVMNGSESGQTVGKKVMNIRVRKASGGPLGIGPAALRYIVYAALASFTCGIGALLDVLWPLWDAKRQTLHDKAVSSVVVDA
jgi:uncharacterized RDD family membrane protein YckC